jgi:hypothetical protein
MGQTKSTLASIASKIVVQKPLKQEFEDLLWTTICSLIYENKFLTILVTVSELEKLYGIFASISSSIDDDGVIDAEEFQVALGTEC